MSAATCVHHFTGDRMIGMCMIWVCGYTVTRILPRDHQRRWSSSGIRIIITLIAVAIEGFLAIIAFKYFPTATTWILVSIMGIIVFVLLGGPKKWKPEPKSEPQKNP